MNVARPPRLAELLLKWTLPPGVAGQSIKGDLDQEYRELAAAKPGRSLRVWYWRQALALAVHFKAARLRRRRHNSAESFGRVDRMDRLRQNLSYSLRRFRRNPGFTLVVVVTIALGIGANVAIFSVVNAVLLKPLPYRSPERLATIQEWHIREGRDVTANPGNFRDLKERSRTFEDITALTDGARLVVITDGEPEEITMALARSNFFQVLGVDAALGRTFSPEAGTGNESLEVLLTHRYWQRKFGGDRAVIGETINIQGTSVPVVGVLPPVYLPYATEAEVWLSYSWRNSTQTNSGRWLRLLGRLSDGAEWETAQEEMDVLAASLRDEYPGLNAQFGIRVLPLQELVVGDVKASLWILLGAVGLLLLIACANVANLFLARTTERKREMAIRSALGASSRRLTGQLLTESLMVAFVGATLGVLLAHFGARWIAMSVPDAFTLPRVEAAGLSGSVLVFAVVAMMLTGILFGLAPALYGSSVAPAAALAAEERGAGRRAGATRNALVVLEVALSCMLLVGAGLMGRSFLSLVSVDPGFEAQNVLTAGVNVYGSDYQEDGVRLRFYDELLAGIDALPGVEAAGATVSLPIAESFARPGTFYYVEDRPMPEREDQATTDIRNVHGEYFAALGIPLLQGRKFDERDRADAPLVVIVNRTLAERNWPDESPVGKRLSYDWGEWRSLEIVGVVGDVHMQALDERPTETIYVPHHQLTDYADLKLAIRSSGDPAALADGVSGVLRALDPTLTLSQVHVMEDLVADSVSRPRMTSFLMALFAGLAALIAAVGLYGVLSYLVSLRVREIGIRMAVGAGPTEVLGMVVRQGLGLVGIGLLVGLIGALVGTRALRSLLFGVEPTDPMALAGSAILLLLVSLAACAVPAWRAARVEPVEALSVQ